MTDDLPAKREQPQPPAKTDPVQLPALRSDVPDIEAPPSPPPQRTGGPIAWMARNAVAANLLMLLFIIGGFFMMTEIRQEYLPNIDSDKVEVTVALPGATPAEVEQSIILAIENAVSDVEGIEDISAAANEGSGSVTLELSGEKERTAVYNDIRTAVDAVTSLPEDAEDPVVKLSARRFAVLEVHLFGEASPLAMRMAAEHLRTYLLQQPDITQVDIANEQDLVLHVDVSDAALRSYGISLEEIAQAINASALDRSGGTLETSGGDLLLRMADRRDTALDFSNLVILTTPQGTVVRLGDIADIRQGFGDTSKSAQFDGLPAVEVEVYRVGDQTPITVSETVRRVLPDAIAALPEAIEAKVLNDRSEYYRGRMELLTRNGLIGLALVLLLLTLFLEVRLAFWVALGIPTAFLGTLLVLPWTDSSINLVSMFAFILALGIVVDDAIVAGENIYEFQQRGMRRMEAAIKGARDIAVPLSFSILTNIVAFIPLALVPGWMGKLWFVVPVVVALAFIMSWIEALFILPAHLGHGKQHPDDRSGFGGPVIAFFGALDRWFFRPIRTVFGGGLAWFTRAVYGPLLTLALAMRYVTIAIMIAILAIAYAWVESGRMGWGLFPPVPRDYSKAVVSMPTGTPMAVTEAARDAVVAAAGRVIEANGGDKLGVGVQANINDTKVDVRTYLTDPDTRPMPTRAFTAAWRKELGDLPSARSVRFESSWGGPGGTSMQIRLAHSDADTLALAAAELARRLGEFKPVRDVDDGFTPGKTQIEFRLTEAGRSLGLTPSDVASQVRAAFYGIEALAQQDGRNEISVRVRRPVAERESESDFERLTLRTPDGGTVPLYDVAEVVRSRADSRIIREDGQRVVNVTANVEPRGETNQVIAAATSEVLPALQDDFPGLAYSLEGRQAAQRETMSSFFLFSIPLALIIIYALLAIPFRSFFQPVIIMLSIPFGFVGAIIGHEIMGMGLSIISVFGIIALSGVVINAGIVMIDYANRQRLEGVAAKQAIWQAGQRRFRPILLTTVTTFGGLAPMIFETSRQAQFLIPMAISLGYGIVFATVIMLFLIPCLYMVLEDIKYSLKWMFAPGLLINKPDPSSIPGE